MIMKKKKKRMMMINIVVVSLGSAGLESFLFASLSLPISPTLPWGLDHWLRLDFQWRGESVFIGCFMSEPP